MAVPYYPQITITPNLGLSLIGMDEVIAEDMILIDAALGGGGSGVTLQTNGVNNTVQTLLNLKSTDASMVLVADGAGGVGFSSKAYADAHLNGALITGTISLGKIPIGQTGGNVVWADPVVQGVYTEGATIAAPGAPGDLSTIQPIYIGANKAGLLSGLLLDSSGNLNVNVAAASGSGMIVVGNKTHNTAVPGTDNLGVLAAIATTAVPTYTDTDQVALSTNLAGSLRTGIMMWAGTTLGAPTGFGTTPGAATAASANASMFVGTVAVVANSGTATTGTPRVVIATDQPAFTNAMPVTMKPSTTGGTSVARGSIGATATAVKASAGQMFGYDIFNSNVAPVYMQVFNVAAGSVTLGTTAPVMSIGIAPGSPLPRDISNGIAFSTAISIAFTTSPTGLGNPPNTVEYNIQFV